MPNKTVGWEKKKTCKRQSRWPAIFKKNILNSTAQRSCNTFYKELLMESWIKNKAVGWHSATSKIKQYTDFILNIWKCVLHDLNANSWLWSNPIQNKILLNCIYMFKSLPFPRLNGSLYQMKQITCIWIMAICIYLTIFNVCTLFIQFKGHFRIY